MGANDLLDWVRCWVPVGGRVEVAETGYEKERGAAGPEKAWAVRKDGRYAIVWVSNGVIRGKRGSQVAENRRDPMIDRAAICRAVKWGTRAEAVAELEAT